MKLPQIKKDNLKFNFTDESFDDNLVQECINKIKLPFSVSRVFNAKIKEAKVLVKPSEELKAVYEITFDIKDADINFIPGDTIGIIPKNYAEDINYLVDRLSLREHFDKIYELSPIDSSIKFVVPSFIPVKAKLSFLLNQCLDLRCIVKKLFLLALSEYTSDENEKKCMQILCSKDGSEVYNKFILKKSISILDILKTFSTCHPPITILVSHLTNLLPRPYSIINYRKYNKNELKICFSVMELNNGRRGLTTGWLEKLVLGMKNTDNLELKMELMNINSNLEYIVPLYLRKNLGFSLPENLKRSIIMIAHGTGVAPFLAFLEERHYCKNPNYGESWLFFGCKSPKSFIYEEKLKFFKECGVLNKFSVAFSSCVGHTKEYVQDLIKTSSKEIIEKLENNGVIYICGDLGSLTCDIENVLIESYTETRHKTKIEATEWIKKLKTTKQIILEAWS